MHEHNIREMIQVLYQKGLVDELEKAQKLAVEHWRGLEPATIEPPHTSAPWHNFGGIIHSQGKHIAHLVSHDDTPENRANAILMAAAPELLESAKLAMEIIEDEKCADSLRTAIAKATRQDLSPAGDKSPKSMTFVIKIKCAEEIEYPEQMFESLCSLLQSGIDNGAIGDSYDDIIEVNLHSQSKSAQVKRCACAEETTSAPSGEEREYIIKVSNTVTLKAISSDDAEFLAVEFARREDTWDTQILEGGEKNI